MYDCMDTNLFIPALPLAQAFVPGAEAFSSGGGCYVAVARYATGLARLLDSRDLQHLVRYPVHSSPCIVPLTTLFIRRLTP